MLSTVTLEDFNIYQTIVSINSMIEAQTGMVPEFGLFQEGISKAFPDGNRSRGTKTGSRGSAGQAQL